MEELVSRYGISQCVFEEAVERAKTILDMKYKGAGHQTYRHRLPEWQDMPNPPLVFSFPHQRRHVHQVEKVVECYELLPESRKHLVQWGVSYFIQFGATQKTEFRFEKKESLRRFLRVLNVLKLYVISKNNQNTKLGRFRLTLCSNSQIGSTDRNDEWDRWGRGIKLENYQHKDKLISVNNLKKSYVSLQLLSFSPCSSPQKNNPGKRQTDWGFRLSMYVLAYAYGWEIPTG